MIRLFTVGISLFGLVLATIALHQPGAEGTVGTPVTYRLVVICLWAAAVLHLVAVRLIVRLPDSRQTFWIVLAIAMAMRACLLMTPPFLSTDIYRYVWDGWVQAAGTNPYRYIPADEHLAPLRDEAVYPHINRADYAPTIYPPAAQALFRAVGLVWPTVIGMKAAMLLLDGVAMLCLARLLILARKPLHHLAIYAWCPLTVWEFAGNGHIDAAVAALSAGALLLRVLRLELLCGVAFGLDVAAKLFPIALLPVLWHPSRGSKRLPLAALAVIGTLYVYYSIGGANPFGFLQGYGQEEGLNSGDGFWLLAVLRHGIALPESAGVIYALIAAVVLLGLGSWIALKQHPDGVVPLSSRAGLMMAAATFAISPHYPWYFAWLAVPATIVPHPALLWLCAAPVLIYVEGYEQSLVWPTVIFAPAIIMALWPLRSRLQPTIAQSLPGNA